MDIQARGTRTAKAPSPHNEQRVRLVLEAEIWKDIDGGPDTFCATTDKLACEPMSPARFLGLLEEATTKLDAMKRLALEFEARNTLAAIIAEHDLTLIEVDMRTVAAIDPDVPAALRCWAGKHNGRLIVWVPKDQDPVERVNAIADLVNDPNSVVREG
jgi:hypothetical protein